MPLEPTAKDVLFRDGTASLYRFRTDRGVNDDGPAVLLVPSMINRWYVLDLRPGASVAAAFVEAGFDTFLLDWGVPNDEDRHLTWDDVIRRLHRVVRRTQKVRPEERLGLLGYCMGATLCGIYVATHPGNVSAFVNLAGPFDFAKGGMLTHMVNPDWFDVDAISAAGNVMPVQMQSGFAAMRPTNDANKVVTYLDRMLDPAFRASFGALDEWASDNIAFPASAYRTYISQLYQKNALVNGEHWVCGRRADLSTIDIPVLTIAAARDHICPPGAATGLNDHVGSEVNDRIVIKGGHVGAVVGSRAANTLYPKITSWFTSHLDRGLDARMSC